MVTDPLAEVERLLAPCPSCDLGGGEEASCTCSEWLPVETARWLLAEVQVLREQLTEAGLLLWNLPQVDDHDWAMRARKLSARINDTLIGGIP